MQRKRGRNQPNLSLLSSRRMIDLQDREEQPRQSLELINYLVTADSYLPHSGGSRVYYANLYRHLLCAYPDTITLVTKKVPGWQEFDRRESTERFRIRRQFHPLPNWRYSQLPKAIPQFMHSV